MSIKKVNITAGAGEFTLTANSTLLGKELSTKVGSDLFAIDGTKIVVAATGSDVAALNAELATLAVNGKYLQISEGVGTQTLNVIPEPASIGLICAMGAGMFWVRRIMSL